MTSDGKQVVVSATVVFEIEDIHKAVVDGARGKSRERIRQFHLHADGAVRDAILECL